MSAARPSTADPRPPRRRARPAFAARWLGRDAFAGRRVAAVALVALAAFALVPLQACQHAGADLSDGQRDKSKTIFEIAMIPDTQNYVDYSHQRAEGFVFDASHLLMEQMRWIASRTVGEGGKIAFVAAVGDVWQHQSLPIAKDHADRGQRAVANPFFAGHFDPTPKTQSVEIPKAIEAYEILADSEIPFGVAPGNHDYDAMWTSSEFPPNTKKARDKLTFSAEDIGILHVGGLDNFRSAFGDDKPFFAGKPWYVASFRGGANSAQLFEAGGYAFLHFALEMQADDEVVAWVESVMKKHPGHPTILSTHDYLDPRGERRANPIIDLDRVDPDHHNSAEELFRKLIAKNDQIFLVLCGHHHGQSFRVDENEQGHEVYQMLADYQDRGQAGLDSGQPLDPYLRGPTGIGDGWLRILRFETGGVAPRIDVRTYSTHYRRLSSELERYADWYRPHEQPNMSDAEFLAAEEFTVPLVDFRERFGPPNL
ncbi:MAG: metallophosphoesterase [Deltaproteobacteria bacterium]|nr:metallophosphoesterase [Deltaproteobacteria bacterium]